ncbi:MAG: prepilin-type N-terminal cleavage/methylation domain-containing protein [Candidatus Pacebacteria bacterium]|nr:prepilin-type N-terminal cleavage/methylation domain-containing protein [Candidatus Paceibacterota bacterium]
MKQFFTQFKTRAGFTMIELLIVITILGILAVAVLSAINPIEQINRGRDTGSRSDAEQLVSAIDRYYAFNGYYPWQTGASDPDDDIAWQEFDTDITDSGGTCTIFEKLGTEINAGCTGAQELKDSFLERVTDTTYNTLYVYNAGTTGSSTYVCYVPQSQAFRKEAEDRCEDATGAGMPSDASDIADTVCGGYGDDSADIYICLP